MVGHHVDVPIDTIVSGLAQSYLGFIQEVAGFSQWAVYDTGLVPHPAKRPRPQVGLGSEFDGPGTGLHRGQDGERRTPPSMMSRTQAG